MNGMGTRLFGALRILGLLWPCIFAEELVSADLRVGKVVWWGEDITPGAAYSAHTNGLIEAHNEVLDNVVAISTALALKRDTTVVAFGGNMYGGNDVPTGLSNVVSIAIEGNSCWAIKRDRTVIRWGSDEDEANVVAGLSNITTIAWAGYRSYLALRNDGTVLGFHLDHDGSSSGSAIKPAVFRGQVLSNVVGLTSMGGAPLVLKDDGTVLSLQFGNMDPVSGLPIPDSQLFSTEVITLGGQPLTNIVALSGGARHALALRRDATVVAWGGNHYGETTVPAGLSNVTAIAAGAHLSLALKSDGTVVAWGRNDRGQTSVPAGLSNVVAIAAGGGLSLALTTGMVPSSVFIYPHGRLEEMEREADVIFKGQVISSRAVTNTSFPFWGNPHATCFRLISVLKGHADTNELVFWHNTSRPRGWGGGSPPSWHQFGTGQFYLVFAARLAKPGYLYSVPSDATNRLNEFRQLDRDGVMRTLDARPLASSPVKEVHWFELNLLLGDTQATNQLYAIGRLDRLSLAGRRDDQWLRSDDFKRKGVLTALLPLVTNDSERVASAAISCFATETNAVLRLAPFAAALVKVANNSPSPNCRLVAIDALSGIMGEAVSNALAQLLRNPDGNIRVGAVRLLPRFPGTFLEHALRERAGDESADVRSVVADVIGEGKYAPLLPTLAKLFADPVGKDPLIEPLTLEHVQAGQRWSNIGDVHTSAGLALVEFDPEQVADILKTNLADPGFHINFVSKLAEKDAEPWLPELVSILEARLQSVDEFSRLPPLDPRRFDPIGDKILVGTYAKCWEDIRQCLLKLPPEKLSGGEMDHYMDLLEKTVRPLPGCCAVQEARSLYELYWTKGLAKRVSEIRRRYDKTDDWWFDDFDQHHPR